MANHHDAAEARAAATVMVTTLQQAGHLAYFAGGCVRDELLGLEPADYDVATGATPHQITSLFRRTDQVGASFGVVLVHEEDISIEVATFRSDGTYSDNRRPDSVEFSNPEADAQRRDFTVNALFLDPLDIDLGETVSPMGGRVIDHVGGLADLDAQIIRAVGNPADRLAEDHLRALRAVRLAAKLSFSIDRDTKRAITDAAGDLKGVSRERVGDEIRRMLIHPTRHQAAASLTALRLDASALDAPHLGNPLPILAGLSLSAPYPIALAAWAIDRNAHACPDHGRETLRQWRTSLCLTNLEYVRTWDLLSRITQLPGTWAEHSVAEQKRTASADWFGDFLILLDSCDASAAANLAKSVNALRATPSGLAPKPLVSGDDLIAQGYQPGPRFKFLLDQAYDAQLEDRIRSAEQALELVRELSV